MGKIESFNQNISRTAELRGIDKIHTKHNPPIYEAGFGIFAQITGIAPFNCINHMRIDDVTSAAIWPIPIYVGS